MGISAAANCFIEQWYRWARLSGAGQSGVDVFDENGSGPGALSDRQRGQGESHTPQGFAYIMTRGKGVRLLAAKAAVAFLVRADGA
jgi:hypothetical protein